MMLPSYSWPNGWTKFFLGNSWMSYKIFSSKIEIFVFQNRFLFLLQNSSGNAGQFSQCSIKSLKLNARFPYYKIDKRNKAYFGNSRKIYTIDFCSTFNRKKKISETKCSKMHDLHIIKNRQRQKYIFRILQNNF